MVFIFCVLICHNFHHCRRTSGISSALLRQHFHTCPLGADEDVVQRYARAWLWHMMGGFLFPDGTGNNVTCSVLPIIAQPWENIAGYSWGSATLAFLYWSLCDACRRVQDNSNLGGCLYLLQTWIWERVPVGRPVRGPVLVRESKFCFL
jgi:hypothetical protein